MNINDCTSQTGDDGFYHVAAGCGKRTKLCKMATEADDPIILSFTNKAAENVKERLKRMKEYGLVDECHTFDSYFCDYHGRDMPDLEVKTVFIEEYSMVPNKWMTKVYQAFTKYGNTVYLFGDTNHCDPVEKGSQVHQNYFESKTIKEVYPKRVKLEYIKGCSRYDIKTRDMLTKFLKNGKVQAEFPAIGKYYENICYLSKTRKTATELCCNHFVQNKDHCEVNFKYNGKIEHYKVAVGMPMLVTQNLKKEEMYNMMEFEIEEMNITEHEFKINYIWFELNDFRKSFILAFCSTVYNTKVLILKNTIISLM